MSSGFTVSYQLEFKPPGGAKLTQMPCLFSVFKISLNTYKQTNESRNTLLYSCVVKAERHTNTRNVRGAGQAVIESKWCHFNTTLLQILVLLETEWSLLVSVAAVLS